MPSDDFTPPEPPKTHTQPARDGGNAGAGHRPVATDFKEEKHRPPSRTENVFGIDFGQAKTRVAGIRGWQPYLIGSLVLPSSVQRTESSADGTLNYVTVDGLRTKLRHTLNGSRDNDSPFDYTKTFFEYLAARLTYSQVSPNVVLTVPAYYCSAERLTLKRCAEAAGFRVLGLINDYAAAMQAYARGHKIEEGKFGVLSIGADAVSAAIMKVRSGLVETIISKSFSGLGGEYFFENISARVIPELRTERIESEFSVNAGSSTEQCIKLLGSRSESPSRNPDSVVTELLEVTAESIAPAINAVSEILTESGNTSADIKSLLFVGGVFESSYVEDVVLSAFPHYHKVFLNNERSQSFGAAIAAMALLQHASRERVFDVLTQNISMCTDETSEVILDKGKFLPISHTVPFKPGITFEQEKTSTEFAPDSVSKLEIAKYYETVVGKTFINITVDVNGIAACTMQKLDVQIAVHQNLKTNVKVAQYVFKSDSNYTFMDSETYEQFELCAKQIGPQVRFLKEGQENISVSYATGTIQITLPAIVELRIVKISKLFDEESSNEYTEACLETGTTIDVPSNLQESDIIRIEVASGKFIDKVGDNANVDA